MADIIKFFALGGLSGSNNNLYCVEINDDIFVYSAGCGFPDRFTPGVDYVICDFSYLIIHKENIKAYFVPSATQEELGAIPYVYRECPATIYTTKYNENILNLVTQSRGLDIKYDVVKVNLPSELKIDGRKFTFFRTCTNSPDTFGLAINTDKGNIIFSGNFIVEYSINPNFALDLTTLSKLGKEEETLLLLMNSRNASRPGYTSPKHRVYDTAVKGVRESKGKTYIAIYRSNIYNFLELLFAAINNNKYVCFYDKESQLILQLILINNIAIIPFKNIITAQNLSKYDPQDVVIIICGEGSQLYEKIGTLAEEEDEEIDKNFIIKEEDTFILACPPSANFELLSIAIIDELYRKDCNVIEISRKDLVYMHPSADDIKVYTAILNPKYFVPIKGNYKDLDSCKNIFAEMHDFKNIDSIFLLDNGEKLVIDGGPARIEYINEAKIGDVLVDGSGVGDVANQIINERNSLASDGIVAMSCLVNLEKKTIIAGPDVQMRGFLFVKESENVISGLTNIFVNMINEYFENREISLEELEENIREECEKLTRKLTMRTPVFTITILTENSFK